MTLSDYWNSQLPDYYDTMYLDGYTPQQILQALRNTKRKKYETQREQERLEKEALKMVEQNFEKVVKLLLWRASGWVRRSCLKCCSSYNLNNTSTKSQ